MSPATQTRKGKHFTREHTCRQFVCVLIDYITEGPVGASIDDHAERTYFDECDPFVAADLCRLLDREWHGLEQLVAGILEEQPPKGPAPLETQLPLLTAEEIAAPRGETADSTATEDN
jgi:hypothetical protein